MQENIKISTCYWMCFVSLIPIVGLAYLIACSANKDINKRNLARALLILRGSVLTLGILLAICVILAFDALL